MSTDPQTIRSYDENADDWSARIRAGKNIAHEHLEKPAMYSELGDVNGLAVLCAGCGSGEECEYVRRQGAARVVGIDASRGLVEKARFAFPGVEFRVQDMERLDFPDGTFDLVYSSLAMHYLRDWRPALSNFRRVLKPGGRVLLSTHHPVKWGAAEVEDGPWRRTLMGYAKNADTGAFETYGDYFTVRLVRDQWFGKMDVNYYHKPLEDIFRDVEGAGLAVARLLEPRSTPDSAKVKPDFHAIHQKIPLFLILSLKKTS